MRIDSNTLCSERQNRRRILQLGGSIITIGAFGVSSTSATTSQSTTEGSGGRRPEFSNLAGVDGGYEDHRGEDRVTVKVGASGNGGNIAFSPAGIWIDPGTTVVWEWTGKGGGHTVVSQDGPASFDSGDNSSDENPAFSYTFSASETGITNYQCTPHAGLNHLGAVAVGEDIPTVDVQSTDGAPDETTQTEISDEPPEGTDDQTQTSDESANTESENESNEGDTSTSVPGFGVLSSLTALGSVSYIIERRLTDD